MSAFFGKQSPFEIIVAVVALVTGAYTLYKSLLERAKLSIYPGDRVGFVISLGGGVSKFQLHLTLANDAVKMGTLQRLEAAVRGPGDWSYAFCWNLFFEYLPGGNLLEKSSEPFPIAVAGKSSRPLFTEFALMPAGSIRRWPQGEYEFRLYGWVNEQNRHVVPNVAVRFHARIGTALSRELEAGNPAMPIVRYASVTEWVDG